MDKLIGTVFENEVDEVGLDFDNFYKEYFLKTHDGLHEGWEKETAIKIHQQLTALKADKKELLEWIKKGTDYIAFPLPDDVRKEGKNLIQKHSQ